MKSKLRFRFLFSLFSVTVFLSCEGSGQSLSASSSNNIKNQYSSYPAYSTLGNSGADSATNSGDVSNKSGLDLVSQNVVGDSYLEGSQRAHQVTGYNPQAQGSHNMFYYQMYPAGGGKTGQKCTYTGDGMKCQFRRDASVGGDSYSAAAASAPSSSYGTPMMSYGAPAHYGETGSDHEDEEGGKDGSLGGLAGLVGLVGLKGLKGLKALAPFSIFLPLLPLLLPILPILPILLALLPIILGALLLIPLLFVPIPIVVVPQRRNLQGSEGSREIGMISIARMATQVLDSEECVERLSCEIARVSRKYNYSSTWLERLAEKMLAKNSPYGMKVAKGLKAEDKKTEEGSETESSRIVKENDGCHRFQCKPKSILAKHFVH